MLEICANTGSGHSLFWNNYEYTHWPNEVMKVCLWGLRLQQCQYELVVCLFKFLIIFGLTIYRAPPKKTPKNPNTGDTKLLLKELPE